MLYCIFILHYITFHSIPFHYITLCGQAGAPTGGTTPRRPATNIPNNINSDNNHMDIDIHIDNNEYS